jgi:hypothetical protein
MALHRSSKFNAADGLFETEKPAAPVKKKEQAIEKKVEEPAVEEKPEEKEQLIQETTEESIEKVPENDAVVTKTTVIIPPQKTGELNVDSTIEPETPVSHEKNGKKLSATAIMPRKVPKKASESVINRTYTIDQGTYDLMSALVRFMRDSKVKDEETGYLINESSFIRRAIRTEMDRVFDSNDEAFSDSVRKYLDKPLKSSPSRITY